MFRRNCNILSIWCRSRGEWYHVDVQVYLEQKHYIQAGKIKDEGSWDMKREISRKTRDKNHKYICLVNVDQAMELPEEE